MLTQAELRTLKRLFTDVSEVYNSLQTLLATLKTAHRAGTAEPTAQADEIRGKRMGKSQAYPGERTSMPCGKSLTICRTGIRQDARKPPNCSTPIS